MKNLKKIIVTGLLALSVATTAFATSAYNPSSMRLRI